MLLIIKYQNNSNVYLISAAVSQCCNAIEDFHFRQKIRLITCQAMARYGTRLTAWPFHLEHRLECTKML